MREREKKENFFCGPKNHFFAGTDHREAKATVRWFMIKIALAGENRGRGILQVFRVLGLISK